MGWHAPVHGAYEFYLRGTEVARDFVSCPGRCFALLALGRQPEAIEAWEGVGRRRPPCSGWTRPTSVNDPCRLATTSQLSRHTSGSRMARGVTAETLSFKLQVEGVGRWQRLIGLSVL